MPEDIQARVNRILNDEVFQRMELKEQIGVLEDVDPTFKKLSPEDQMEVVGAKKKGWGEALKEDAGQYIGGGVGEAIGTGIPLPLARPVTAGLLGAVGKGIQETSPLPYVKELVQGRPPEEVLRGIRTHGMAAKETLPKEMGKAFLEEALSQKGGEVGAGLLKGVLSPFGESIKPSAQQAYDRMKGKMPFRKTGPGYPEKASREVPYSPAELTEHKGLDIMENVVEKSLLGTTGWAAHKEMRDEILTDTANEIREMLGIPLDNDAMGKVLVGIFNKEAKVTTAMTRPLYKQAFKLDGKKSNVPLKSIRKIAEQHQKTASGKASEWAGDTLAESVAEYPEYVGFQHAHELRKRLLEEGRQITKAGKGGASPAERLSKLFAKHLDQAIEQEVGHNSPDALRMWRRAGAITKERKGKWESDLINGLVRMADPDVAGGKRKYEGVVKAIYSPPNISNVQEIYSKVDPGTELQLKSYYIQHVLDQARDPATGVYSGKKLKAVLDHKNRAQRKVHRTALGDKALRRLDEYADELTTGQDRQAGGLGGMWIQLAQGTAGVTLVGGAAANLLPESMLSQGKQDAGSLLAGGSAVIIMGPGALAKMLLWPPAHKYLTKGIWKMPEGSIRAGGTMGRIMRAAWEVERSHDAYLRGEPIVPQPIPPISKKIKPLSPKTPTEKLRTIKLPPKPKPKPRQETKPKPKQTSQAPKKPRQTSTKTDQTPPSQRGGAHHKKTKSMEKTATIGNVTKNDTQVGNYSIKGPVSVEETLRKLLR